MTNVNLVQAGNHEGITSAPIDSPCTGAGEPTNYPQTVPIEEINVLDRTFQYRLTVSNGHLSASLLAEGQKEPVDLTDDTPRRVIDGFRRLSAAMELGWSAITAIIHRQLSEDSAHKLAFIKNAVRKNLTPLEKANAIFLAKKRGLQPADIGRAFSLSSKQLRRYEELLDLSGELKQALEEDSVSMAHAKLLRDFKVPDPHAWAIKIKEDNLSTGELQRILRAQAGVGTSGRTRTYLKVGPAQLRLYPFAVSKATPKSELDKVIRLLRNAINTIESWSNISST